MRTNKDLTSSWREKQKLRFRCAVKGIAAFGGVVSKQHHVFIVVELQVWAANIVVCSDLSYALERPLSAT